MADTPPKLLLSPQEVSHLLGVSRSYLFELLASGQVPSVKLGKLRRIPAAALEAWVERQTPPYRGGDDLEDAGEEPEARPNQQEARPTLRRAEARQERTRHA